MIISIHQPDYIPYLGYFYKISKADAFVFLDDVQFSNDNMHHWNRVKNSQGECRLKIPVEQHLGDLICAVRTKDELLWKQKHLKTLEMNYAKAPFFGEIFPHFEALLSEKYNNISDMNVAINTWIAGGFGFTTKFYRSSKMNINSVREDRVIDIVKSLGGDTYISGTGAKTYQTTSHFSDQGIELVYTDYKPIVYKQLWPKVGFLPYMSVLDYIFNHGFDWDQIEKEVKDLNQQEL